MLDFQHDLVFDVNNRLFKLKSLNIQNETFPSSNLFCCLLQMKLSITK